MKARPDVSLAPLRQRARARDFLHELGSMMFPKTWKLGHIKYLSVEQKNDTKGNASVGIDEALIVCDNLIDALKLGMAVAQVELTHYAIGKFFPEEPTVAEAPTTASSIPGIGAGENLQIDDAELWPEEAEEPGEWDKTPLRTPAAGFYTISKTYWSEHDDDAINWDMSTIKIPGEFVLFRNTDALSKTPAECVAVEVFLYILEPDELLSKIFKMPPLLSAAEISKYLDVKRTIWLEIIAAAWRLLAIHRPDTTEHGFQANLIKELRNYMHLNKLEERNESGFSNDTMEAVVRNIFRQWHKKETGASVRVSSVASRVPISRSNG
jgi:hypothetical protein